MTRDPRITALLRWYRQHGRTLPWRTTNDPYRIFISEIMLQQTQASRVIDFFDAWLKRFPNWKSLADATTPDLLHAWAGLGYNRRALYLREAAKRVVEHGIPTTEAKWRLLKGVGPYTAAAVYAFTSKRPAAAVDTNIRRVVGRYALGISSPVLVDDPRVIAHLKKFLNRPGDWLTLHALMDIGAMICSPKSPDCERCPFYKTCKARRSLSKPIARSDIKKKIHETIQEGKKFPDRIYRGRILKIVRTHKRISISSIGPMIDSAFQNQQDSAWLLRMIDRMKRDGFIKEKNSQLTICD